MSRDQFRDSNPAQTDPDGLASESGDDDRQSKSARKRQMHALQALGERLLKLTPGKLAPLPLSDNLREALATYHRIRRGAREGRRRQSQLIGKLMRSEDTAQIAQMLDSERDAHKAQGLTQQLAAQWRDRLASGPTTELAEFESEFGLGGDLRDLVLRARREVENDRPPQAQRLLYRRILKRLSE
ncbi:MAG: ribosome biogenesis factor YjgA [Burkholderiaceae bacterium]